ncbi:nitrile hydratase subunit beta [Rhizobium hidalgonense]|uniref:nitrile hydratase n=1 Tax=Rhizobium hidalgonense TaxID=1538159 RepID=A0A2A6K8X5_9HYPH|nr:nitrile hydratase subunit beta [Rhizobium hidalgonense]MDR9777333.1 nitrile hydratase subunit beta [Rhizobium hidalgonense]MDR9814949.1 nitrile hydratase subunit beta [Rhizobium hidalgonense]MDR9823593.1 nitrile hydratase subunit beta [Rhizobium hidalgonense]PDT21346.1 nitrile hydratase subunit beta [Rhizobium hidalgonense]PON08004.1 nitrile hydratase subunit beta [Rhizobium hidalgonense]
MKLQHYLGGLEGLGPVSTETRVFVETWETRIFGIHTAMMALSSQLSLPPTPSNFTTVWTWADLRKGAESLNPFDYFKFRYYEKWLGGISGYFIDKGYITAEELDALTEEYYRNPSKSLPAVGDAAIDNRVVQYLVEGDSPKRDTNVSFDFAVGDLVSIKDVPSIEHSRLPGFLRNKSGTVETVYDGAYVYLCDTGTDGIGAAMPVYCIRFEPADLWPGNTEKNFSLYADLYSHYVETPAAASA